MQLLQTNTSGTSSKPLSTGFIMLRRRGRLSTTVLRKPQRIGRRISIHLLFTPPLFVPMLRRFWRRASTHCRRLHAKRREAPSSCSIEVVGLTSSPNASAATGVSVIITTRKLKSCLHSLKCPIPEELSSRVLYQLTCTGCKACYVGQTSRHFKTRLQEHRRAGSPVGAHLRECGDDNFSPDLQCKILDRSIDTQKLLTLEAPYISRKAPALISEEYRQRQLTLRF